MTDEEVDELLKAVDTSSGEINYTGRPFYDPDVRRSEAFINTVVELVRMILAN